MHNSRPGPGPETPTPLEQKQHQLKIHQSIPNSSKKKKKTKEMKTQAGQETRSKRRAHSNDAKKAHTHPSSSPPPTHPAKRFTISNSFLVSLFYLFHFISFHLEANAYMRTPARIVVG